MFFNKNTIRYSEVIIMVYTVERSCEHSEDIQVSGTTEERIRVIFFAERELCEQCKEKETGVN